MPANQVSPAGYQYAQQVGSQLFVAGQVPMNEENSLVGINDPTVQAMQCLDNLSTLIQKHEFLLSDIRYLRIYAVGEQSNLNSAWSEVVRWFGGEAPPATLLGVSKLGYIDQIVEIDATIVKDTEPSI